MHDQEVHPSYLFLDQNSNARDTKDVQFKAKRLETLCLSTSKEKMLCYNLGGKNKTVLFENVLATFLSSSSILLPEFLFSGTCYRLTRFLLILVPSNKLVCCSCSTNK